MKAAKVGIILVILLRKKSFLKLGLSKIEKLEITVHPHKTKRRELLNACQMIVEQTRKEAGCIDSRLLKGEKDENGIILEQHWKQRHQLDGYFRTDHFSALLGAMKLLAIDWEMAINGGTPEKANEAVKNARGP